MVASLTIKGVENTPRLPPGKYKIVGFDLDRTGRRLIDEICHIAVYTPNSQFSQYVMPFKDISMGFKHRHLLTVVTVGRYRMLKCDNTGKILKTKSEISAITDFVQWLENLKAEGVILVTHDTNKTIPLHLLEALHKYNLFDRFTAVVKGFANSFVFVEQKHSQVVKSYSLHSLAKTLLNQDKEMHSAATRARLSYQIVQHLCAVEDDKGSGDATSTPETDSPAMSEALRQIATSVADEDKKHTELKELVKRQNSLRPIFGEKIVSRIRAERYRATKLRRLIAQAKLTYEHLAEAWKKDKKEGLIAVVKERITMAGKPEDLSDLTEILVRHFDRENSPQVIQGRRRRVDKSQSEGGNETGDEAKGDKSKMAGDKESKASSGKSSPGKFASATSSPIKSAAEKTDEDTSR